MLNIVFVTVKNPIDKLSKIYQISLSHFDKREKILILTSDVKAAEFLDSWLWKHSAESFLPHALGSSSSEEWIKIGKDKHSFPDANILFNLHSETPSFPLVDYKIIYEWNDLSSAEKEYSSHRRFLFYREKGYAISME